MAIKKVKKLDLKQTVKDMLLDHISQMDLSVETKLPREEELALMFGVSRITIRSVLDDLANEGIITKKHGKGTFVNPVSAGIQVSFNPVMHFSDMIRNSGYTPSVKIIECRTEAASKEVALALKIKEGQDVIVCVKAFFADDKLCSIVQDYVDIELLPDYEDMTTEDMDSLFYYIYHKTGHTIQWDKTEIQVIYSKEIPEIHHIVKKYGGDDKSYLLLKGINYDERDRETLYALEYVDTDLIKFNQIRKKVITYS